jgi:hypothetical protein
MATENLLLALVPDAAEVVGERRSGQSRAALAKVVARVVVGTVRSGVTVPRWSSSSRAYLP